MSEVTASPPEQPARKQQQRSIVTQQKLLDAAVEAFSENGFKGTSTRDIAERAGVHHPLITYHFKNKDQLWRAAADHIFSAFTRSLSLSLQENQGSTPKERMSEMIYAYIRYAKSQPALHKVMVQEASYPNARLDWLIDRHLKPFFDATSSMLTELQSLGVAPPGNPALLFNMIRLSSGVAANASLAASRPNSPPQAAISPWRSGRSKSRTNPVKSATTVASSTILTCSPTSNKASKVPVVPHARQEFLPSPSQPSQIAWCGGARYRRSSIKAANPTVTTSGHTRSMLCGWLHPHRQPKQRPL